MGSLHLQCPLHRWNHPVVEEVGGEEVEMVGVVVEVAGVVPAEEGVDQEGGVAMEEVEEGDEVADVVVVVGVVATHMVVTLMEVIFLAGKDTAEGAFAHYTV